MSVEVRDIYLFGIIYVLSWIVWLLGMWRHERQAKALAAGERTAESGEMASGRIKGRV